MKQLCIDSETVLVNLFQAEEKEYITTERMKYLLDFIHRQLVARNILNRYDSVIFNVNSDSIERTVAYNNIFFRQIGNMIILKKALTDEILARCKTTKEITEIIKDFSAIEDYQHRRNGQNAVQAI